MTLHSETNKVSRFAEDGLDIYIYIFLGLYVQKEAILGILMIISFQ